MNSIGICEVCEQQFPRRQPAQRYCSRPCRVEGNRRKNSEVNPHWGIGKRVSGALAELRVCADLLTKGYEVFRTVSQSCSCDMVVLKDGVLQRVEVRTTYRNYSGDISRSVLIAKEGKYDLAALVTWDGEIVYEPPIT